MATVKHFVLTKFNLKKKEWGKDKSGDTTLGDEWMKERWQLFENYCLPSMRAQTCTNYTWLLLLDAHTAPVYKQRLEQLRKELPRLTPCYFDELQMSNPIEHVVELIKSMTGDEEYIMTTNLDNDDALHRDMLGGLQAKLNETDKTGLYTYVNGLQYIEHKRLLLRMRYPHNHFLTLVEKSDDDIKTIISYGHGKARKRVSNTVDLQGPPRWLEVVHGHNVSNDLRITSRIAYRPVVRPFSFAEYGIALKLSLRDNLSGMLFRMPPYFVSTAGWRVKRKIDKKRGKRQ